MAVQSNTDYESYYVPEKSPLAICATVGLILGIIGAANVINDMSYGNAKAWSWPVFYVGLIIFVATLFAWFRTAIIENRAGMNSAQLKRSYVIGMQWFIFSEIMFFAAFFGALFYVRNLAGPWLAGEGSGVLNSMVWEGFKFSWPMMETPQQAVGGVANQLIANNGEFSGPDRHLSFPGWDNMLHWLPLWNTIILMSSSVTVHIAHNGLKANNRTKLNLWLGITVLLGLTFVYLQYLEYHEAYVEYGLKLTSGIYGTTFFMLTGFHGAHVCMGTIMLLVQWLRASTKGHFSADDQFGFEASSWYWHFVDVVWVGLFLFVYII
jgi:cytochrome c oxidase subunit 3